MAVFAYTRVSTDRQATEGESLEVQRRVIEGYAMMRGLSVERFFVESGVSGSKPLSERPAGADLLAALRPGDVVVTAKLDRLFRSALDALQVLGALRRSGVQLHMIDLGGDVTSDGVARLVFTILSAVAEAERDRIRERVSTVKADQRRRGRYLGGTEPFGWRMGSGGNLVCHEGEQAVIRAMLAARAQGGVGASYRALAKLAASMGHPLTHEAARRVLARAAAEGMAVAA